MTRQYLVLIIISILILACKRTHERINYRVESKDLANFSVQFPELQPKEKILIKINNEIILEDTTNNPIGNSGFWRYYYYKDKIVKIEFLDFFNGDLKVNKVFKDTLTDVKQRTLIVSRPYPKGLTKENWRPYGFVSIDTGSRKVLLVNDSIAFKGLWTDRVHEIK